MDIQYDLILASSSPRRRDFLNNMGINYQIIKPRIDETAHLGENPQVYVARMAQTKAQVIASEHPQEVVLAADTIVVVGDEILGKPKDREDAKRILRTLSGKTHQVMTAVCIRKGEDIRNFTQSTNVTFAPLNEELIDTYVASGECDDKSGAYAVQGIGAMLIEKVEGSVSSVVGLPICQVRQILSEFKIFPRTVSVN